MTEPDARTSRPRVLARLGAVAAQLAARMLALGEPLITIRKPRGKAARVTALSAEVGNRRATAEAANALLAEHGLKVVTISRYRFGGGVFEDARTGRALASANITEYGEVRLADSGRAVVALSGDPHDGRAELRVNLAAVEVIRRGEARLD